MFSDTSNTKQILIDNYSRLYPEEVAKLLSSFSNEQIINYLNHQPLEISATIFNYLNPDVSASLIEEMNENLYVKIFTKLDPNFAARILSRLDKQLLEAKLSILPANLKKELKIILSYPPDTAGYIIDTKVTTFFPENLIEDVLQRVRKLRNKKIVNIYVINKDGVLVGVIPLQDIAVADPQISLSDLILEPPITINNLAPLEDVVQLMEEKKIINLPVVDINNVLIGVIRHNTLLRTAKEEASEDVMTMFGAGRDERALSKVSFAIQKRLPWLQINLATAFLAAAVVGLFEDTIAQITILAVFLPVVAGQSGNTGSQALAVTIRGLALREIRPRHWFKLARKEMLVGLLNGIAVAITTSIIVYFWSGSIGLPIVIGTSMILSMMIAGLSGAVIPMVLQAVGQDPAQSSSIILTTVTDVFGFLSFLGLASALASVLGIV